MKLIMRYPSPYLRNKVSHMPNYTAMVSNCNRKLLNKVLQIAECIDINCREMVVMGTGIRRGGAEGMPEPYLRTI
ncbi:MAG: hypothetical protein Q4E13_14475 [Clostridia bacterium]|nr:hypothetical protein [Clostridia bacterium]